MLLFVQKKPTEAFFFTEPICSLRMKKGKPKWLSLFRTESMGFEPTR
jgi:hypothetical protein